MVRRRTTQNQFEWFTLSRLVYLIVVDVCQRRGVNVSVILVFINVPAYHRQYCTVVAVNLPIRQGMNSNLVHIAHA